MSGSSANENLAATGSDSDTPNKAPAWALLFDLEFALVEGISILRDVAGKVLSENDVELNDGRFVRYLLGETASDGVGALLASLKQPKSKAAEIGAAIDKAFVEAVQQAAVRPTVKELMEQTLKSGGRVAVATALDTDVAGKLLEAAGLPADDTMVLEAKSEGWAYRSADTWARLARDTNLDVRLCTVVTATADTARAALMAGLNLVALPISLTQYQDFAGADFVGDGETKGEASEIISITQARL